MILSGVFLLICYVYNSLLFPDQRAVAGDHVLRVDNQLVLDVLLAAVTNILLQVGSRHNHSLQHLHVGGDFLANIQKLTY